MADHPLRSATHRRLGRPLPHQLANAPRAHPVVTAETVFQHRTRRCDGLFGISPRFRELSQSTGQVAHVLLTHPPLTQEVQAPLLFARLACIRHAASVRPEPGSNSQKESDPLRDTSSTSIAHFSHVLNTLLHSLFRFLVSLASRFFFCSHRKREI